MPKKAMTEDQRLQAMFDRGRTKGRVEAVAAERERIAVAVEGLDETIESCGETHGSVEKAAVLAIVEDKP